MTVYVITGPPAAGKSTWVREHAKPGDITIDYDTLAAALTPNPPEDSLELRSHVALFYLVHAMPGRQDLNRYRKHGAQIITIDPGYTECTRRASDYRTPRQQAVVEDWYQRRGLTV